MKKIDIEDTEYKCTCCGESYPAADMFDSAICNGCIDFWSDSSKQEARHESSHKATKAQRHEGKEYRSITVEGRTV